jgi:arabinose-5-phosphate isomerase
MRSSSRRGSGSAGAGRIELELAAGSAKKGRMTAEGPSGDARETTSDLDFARAILGEYAAATRALADSLDEGFERAAEIILAASGRLVVGGLGKSGHVARKLAATFSSTGTPALFLHLAEALHGDLGGVQPGDAALLISHSGQTPELAPVIGHLAGQGVPLIGISSNANSALLQAAAAPILLPAWDEVCPQGLAPTTSTLMTLAVGDALAMTVMRARGFGRADFHKLHPAGAIGKRLQPVSAIMRSGEAIPLVAPGTPMLEAVVEMTAKRLGAVGVADDGGRLIGVITDGDLRRHLDELSDATAGAIMTREPKLVRPITLAEDALALMGRHKITLLFVVDDPADPRPIGVVHIHDLAPIEGAA